MDSLMAVELATRLGRLLDTSLPSTFAFDHPTLGALAQHLLAEAVPAEAAVPDVNETTGAPRETSSPAMHGPVDALSQAEVEEQLRRELDEAGF
jgi:hypothetical protein